MTYRIFLSLTDLTFHSFSVNFPDRRLDGLDGLVKRLDFGSTTFILFLLTLRPGRLKRLALPTALRPYLFGDTEFSFRTK